MSSTLLAAFLLGFKQLSTLFRTYFWEETSIGEINSDSFANNVKIDKSNVKIDCWKESCNVKKESGKQKTDSYKESYNVKKESGKQKTDGCKQKIDCGKQKTDCGKSICKIDNSRFSKCSRSRFSLFLED